MRKVEYKKPHGYDSYVIWLSKYNGFIIKKH